MKTKLKTTLLIGIGIGFIISSTLNIIAKEFFTPEINDDFIIHRAKELGMVDKESNFISINKEDVVKQENEKDIKAEYLDEDETIKFKIPQGVNSEEIADILLEKKIIQSKDEFLDEINRLKLSEKIRWGIYEISYDESLESIINKITANN